MGYPEKDYALLAEAIDVDYKTEVELNLMLNSENAHGEWDDMKVRRITAGHKLYGCRINGRRPVPVRL